MSAKGTPVVFVHGLWLHATSWEPWAELFASQGYEPVSPGWPGEPPSVEAARKDPAAVAGSGVNAIVDHHVGIIKSLGRPPVVVGHSFGGLIVQRLLTGGHAAAAVSLDAAPIKGVMRLPLSALKVASIALRNPANRRKALALTREQFRYGFGNALPVEESDALHDRWVIPSPMKPLFEAAFSTFAPNSPVAVDRKASRGPLLLIAGGKDNTAPASIQRTTQRLYRGSPSLTDLYEFPDRGHSLGLDSGWRDVADYSLAWLDRQKV